MFKTISKMVSVDKLQGEARVILKWRERLRGESYVEVKGRGFRGESHVEILRMG